MPTGNSYPFLTVANRILYSHFKSKCYTNLVHLVGLLGLDIRDPAETLGDMTRCQSQSHHCIRNTYTSSRSLCFVAF